MNESKILLCLLKDHLTDMEYADVDIGRSILRKCATKNWLGEELKIYALCDSVTLETRRTIPIMTSDMITWKRWANKILKYIKLRII